MPWVQTPALTKISLEHIGINSINKSTMLKCHDRTRDNIKLQHFSETNLKRHEDLKKYSLQGGHMVEGRGFLDVKNISEALLVLLQLCADMEI